ncbi:MAG: NAD-glutamate dehydrogenase domain-containing protein [Alphaproteobacteria bacterium]
MVTTWTDKFEAAAAKSDYAAVSGKYKNAFPLSYQEECDATEALADIAQIEALSTEGQISTRLQVAEKDGAPATLRLIGKGVAHPLSDVLSTLENLGISVISMSPYKLKLTEEKIWIQNFLVVLPENKETLSLEDSQKLLSEALTLIWSEEGVNDEFNALVLGAGIRWRETRILRAYYKYLRQIGKTFDSNYAKDLFCRYPRITKALVELFITKFDPSNGGAKSDAAQDAVCKRICEKLTKVSSLKEDRTFNYFLNLIQATLRTNFFLCKPYISFKFDCSKIDELPLPRPMYEIFVYAVDMEGVHMRGGKVARGGIRWSDRFGDFRTEILGLVKAQIVKNTVIVPVGSKGGFVVKRQPKEGGREAFVEKGVECYRNFIRGLLDVTDNLDANGAVLPPQNVVRYDDDDPYLVVAADKGTATFSDYANEISAEYSFWLSDAFASGGSVGYDHKKMGITAKGGWESVKRHFREMGTDIQVTDFTVMGVGDMSGDVFGNGMLLSKHIKLVGAFNHMHIFIDPNPDTAKSFAERDRLFKLPRSTWKDYDAALISKGGGIFDRTEKEIPLTPEMKSLLDVSEDTLSPEEVIQALLKAQVDLIWFGGIGTYVKKSTEMHDQVGDKANDRLRVNGKDLRCKVIGEGANLGVTQRGRIEFDECGGRISTDFIDNCGGVSASDHEVNIKIFMNNLLKNGTLSQEKRNALFLSMTDDVGDMVIYDNYVQGQALTLAQAQGEELFDQTTHLMDVYEDSGLLDRAIEHLPSQETLGKRKDHKEFLTRPELSVLLSYAKISVYNEIIETPLTEDPYFEKDLLDYFPTQINTVYAADLKEHRLRKEIIATILTNAMVNRLSLTFVNAMKEKHNVSIYEIGKAFVVTQDLLDLPALWREIESLDNNASASDQVDMLLELRRLQENLIENFLSVEGDIASVIGSLKPQLSEVLVKIDKALPNTEEYSHVSQEQKELIEKAIPTLLTTKVNLLIRKK